MYEGGRESACDWHRLTRMLQYTERQNTHQSLCGVKFVGFFFYLREEDQMCSICCGLSLHLVMFVV